MKICQLKRCMLLDFMRSDRGTSAVEFALIAPVLLTFMLGSVVAFDAARALRQVGTTATTVSDLSTRVEEMTDGRLQSIYDTADALLGKYADDATYNVRISSVVNQLGDDQDTLEVVWSASKTSGLELTDDDLVDYEFPEIPDGESVILVELELDYESPFVFRSLAPTMTLEDLSIRRPRFVNEVCWEVSETEQICSSNNDGD